MALRSAFSRSNSGKSRTSLLQRITKKVGASDPRHVVIGAILLTALIAFEIFNFDTTRYALDSLLAEVSFVGLGWATILAIAFCAIDFAGLARLFTPQKGADEPVEVWYLMGAWLIRATMNAVMTWWAVSVTLLDHQILGNEILDREQLLRIVPIFVAVLVWLTRILFIGSLTVAGEHMFDFHGTNDNQSRAKAKPSNGSRTTNTRANNGQTSQRRSRPAGAMSFSEHSPTAASMGHMSEPSRPYSQPTGMYAAPANPVRQAQSGSVPSTSRVRRRPPAIGGVNRGMTHTGMHAKGKK